MKAKTHNTYGEAAKRYAETLLQRGVDYDEILKEPTLKRVPRATLRLWKSRLVSKVETAETQVETPLIRGDETPEQVTETPLSAQETTVLQDFVKTSFQNFHPADLLYYLGVSIACYGIVATFQGIGVAVSVLIGGVSVLALQGVKAASGWIERLPYAAAFLLVEIVTAISHIAWANASLWRNVAALPFDIYLYEGWSADAGRMKTYWMGQTAWPFYSACGVAVVFFLTGVFVFFISLQSGKKQSGKLHF